MTRRRWFLLGGAILLAWLLAAGFLLLRAAGDLREGRDAADAARERIDAESLAAGAPLPALREARDRFRSAERAVGNPLLAPARFLPVLGRQLRSVHALSGAAAEVSDAAVEAAARVQEVLDVAGGGGSARVTQVRALRDAVVEASERVSAVDDLGPRVGLVGPLAEARNELGEQLAEARVTLADAAAGSEAGLRLLEGPGRYLLVAANNAEMRAGSGMWLTGGVLTTAGGRLSLGEVAPLYQQADPPDGVPIGDADLAARWGELFRPSSDWRALMTSPRLPAAAELGARMWEAAGQPPINGILVVDPVALAAVVRATGPVRVGERTITAEQVVPLLLHEQYLEFGADNAERAERREALGAIAEAAFQALDAGDWRPETLAAELADAVAGRHLLAWSSDPAEQRGWVAAGVAGALDDDSLFVSMLNAGGNKLDWFLQAEGRLEVVPRGDSSEVTVRLQFWNTSTRDLPRYVAGPPSNRDWEPGRYVGVLSVNVPGAATDVHLEGVAEPLLAGPDGPTQVIATEVQLAAGEAREVVLRFRLPGRAGSLRVEPSARVPGITWHYRARSWQDSRRHMANW